MNLSKPQLQLFKKSELQDNGAFRDHYYLNVTTLTNDSNLRAAPEYTEIDTTNLKEGIIHVNLFIQELVTSDNSITPNVVEYYIDLETPIKKGEEFQVQVLLFVLSSALNDQKQTTEGGSGHTSSSGAKEHDRPLIN